MMPRPPAFEHGGDERRHRHAAHAGEADRILDAEQIAERRAAGRDCAPRFDDAGDAMRGTLDADCRLVKAARAMTPPAPLLVGARPGRRSPGAIRARASSRSRSWRWRLGARLDDGDREPARRHDRHRSPSYVNVFHDYGDTAALLGERLGCRPGRRT
jgi:hypothetical protein